MNKQKTKERKMRKTKTQNGITLVALIITIVILLILAIVAIQAVTGDGIIAHARNATDAYEDAQDKEKTGLKWYLSKLESSTNPSTWKDNGNGTFTNAKDGVTVKIGDYVNYTYDTAEAYRVEDEYNGYGNQTIAQTQGLEWRVLGISNNGELELISTTITDSTVSLCGAAGYNNGVYLLNDICAKQYSNEYYQVKARSLNIQDIEKQYTQEAINAKNIFTESLGPDSYGNTGNTSYGEPFECENGGKYYPALYAEEKGSGVNGTIRNDGIGQSDAFYSSTEQMLTTNTYIESDSLMATANYYSLTFANTHFKNEKSYELITASRKRKLDCISLYLWLFLQYS